MPRGRPDTDGDVEAGLDRIGDAIVQRQIDAQPRIGDDKVGDGRSDLGEAEIRRRNDAQFAARLVVKFARRSLGVLQFGENAPALLIERSPGFGDADAACGAIEEPCAKAFFELQHMLAGRGARQAEPLRRRRKPAGLDHGGKNPSVLKTIH